MTHELDEVFKTALEQFQIKGLSFTMEDLSSNMGISKKTLYEIIPSKEAVINLIIHEARNSIKERQAEIFQDDSLDVVTKIQCILKVVPKFHNIFTYKRLLEIKKSYPSLYQEIINLLNEDWEPTFNLFNQGIKEEKIKPINLILFKEIFISALTTVNEKSITELEDISYKQLLNQIISILFDGILL
ncbi:MAG: TetR/AcrR family transcriptional regulator [Clostridiaceae bacterium]